jgi:hypothetical protein
MLRQPYGPVAVVCGSRVTMPYAMSVMSVEMMNEYFQGECETLGELMLKAKQRMVALSNVRSDEASQSKDDNRYRQLLDALGESLSPTAKLLNAECREHVQLMQLLGDPLLRLRRPQDLALQLNRGTGTDGQFKSGEKVVVRGIAPEAGMLQLEIAYQRDRFRHRPSYRGDYDSSDEAFKKIQQDYLKAQDLVCARSVQTVKAGSFELEIEIPVGASGRCDVRAMMLGSGGIALDSKPIRIKSTRRSRGRSRPRADKNAVEPSARTAKRNSGR